MRASTQITPNKTYSAAGTYTVKLTANYGNDACPINSWSITF